MKKILASFLIAITLFCNLPINVYASELGGGGYAHKWVGWSDEEKKSFCRDKLTGAILQRVGIVIQPDKWTSEAWTNAWNKHLGEIEIASGMTYDEYIMSLVSVDEDNEEFVISDSLLDSFHSVANIYIEEETPWIMHRTADSDTFADYYANKFNTKKQYDSFKQYIKENNTKLFYFESLNNYNQFFYDENGNQTEEYVNGIWFYVLDFSKVEFTASKGSYETYNVDFYDSNWENVIYEKYVLDTDGVWHNLGKYKSYSSLRFPLTGKHMSYPYYYYFCYECDNISVSEIDGIQLWKLNHEAHICVTYGGQNIRMYKSLADLKQYTVGQRPYFTTSDFYNYDSTVDNSTTITQTEIDNSVTYGDVYNYITNNYDDPDGLSEDELRAILAEYLSQINNNNSGGGSGGSGDSGGSGGGLGGFLDGLGSVGNAILAILGKLLEYIGKALELLTGTVTKVLDLIPSNITNLLLGLFPFIPQEWVTAIELSLVLGVVLVVVGAFKK